MTNAAMLSAEVEACASASGSAVSESADRSAATRASSKGAKDSKRIAEWTRFDDIGS